jgi:peptidoglycan/xylan/chitin deacetylase (PgdA/CDA1 family)
VPDKVVSAGIYHSISSKGTLITDDYRLDEYSPLALHRPLVTLSFDDGFDPVYTNGLPLLQKYGVITTQFIPTGFLDQPGRFTRSMVQNFAHSGHEIGSHTVTHPILTSLSKAQIDQELMQSQQDLFAITGIRPTSLATPYGAYSSTVTQESSNYYRSMRNVNVGFNSRDNADSFDIKVQDITATTTLNDITTWLAKSKADRTWLVLVYHNLSSDSANAGLYNTPPGEFEKHLQLIKASGITILPINQAVAELKAQSAR